MKRITLAVTAACAASALVLALTAQSGAATRDSLTQALILAALAGFVALVSARPARRRAEALTAAPGMERAAETRCDFTRVAANEAALSSLRTLRDYLRDPEKYARYGARMPRGVLLYGPPGTGKTLMARALAGEAKVPFFALSGSDFVEKYVGVGASRVRALFQKARKAGRCVIFIDEIDALGRRRDDSASDERDQTLNALLSEMSGFREDAGVVVLAATNRAEALDPALLRPGRFDRQIEVGLPGRDQRLSILRLHSLGKPLGADVDLERLAERTVSFSGAALESLLNDAALYAAERGGGAIGGGDVDRAFYRAVAGEDRPMTADGEERRRVAVHEAGHALVGRLLTPENRLERVSIRPAGRGAAGYSLIVPVERTMLDVRQAENQICVLLAGRAAEQRAYGEGNVSAGAAGDLERAAELACAMATEWGMAGEPAVSLKALSRHLGVSEGRERVHAILNALYERTLELLEAHDGALNALAEALVARETLDGDEAVQLMEAAMAERTCV